MHVTRVQANAWLIQHEQGIDQRGAQCRGEVDALHFAATERPALPIQTEVTDAHVTKVAQSVADFFHQHMQSRLLPLDLHTERIVRSQMLKKIAQAVNRHEHHVVQTQARQRFKLGLGPANPMRHEPSGWRQHRIGAGLTAHAPQQAFALQTCAATVMAQRVRTVFGKQDAYVHLVRLGFQVFKETLHPIPLLVPLAIPVG